MYIIISIHDVGAGGLSNAVPELVNDSKKGAVIDITKIPIADNVVEYAVRLVGKTRPESDLSSAEIKKFLSWGAGPRASQYLVLAAKAHGAISGKYSPDIEDVKAVALPILRHRIVRNYKAEAEGMTIEKIVDSLL